MHRPAPGPPVMTISSRSCVPRLSCCGLAWDHGRADKDQGGRCSSADSGSGGKISSRFPMEVKSVRSRINRCSGTYDPSSLCHMPLFPPSTCCNFVPELLFRWPSPLCQWPLPGAAAERRLKWLAFSSCGCCRRSVVFFGFVFFAGGPSHTHTAHCTARSTQSSVPVSHLQV